MPVPVNSKKQALLRIDVLGKPSRQLWIASIVVSAVCVVGLAYALVTDWKTEAEQTLVRPDAASGSGFGVGLLVGLGAGIVVGSLLAARKR